MAIEAVPRLICVPPLRAHPAQTDKPLEKVWLLWRVILASLLLFLPQNIFDPMWNSALCSYQWHLKEICLMFELVHPVVLSFVCPFVCPPVFFYNVLKRYFYLGIKVEMELSGQNNWQNDFKVRFPVRAKASSPVLFLAVHVWLSPLPSDSKQVAISFVRISFWSKYWFSKVLQKKINF